MSARSLAAHLRRYPFWYLVAAVWLVGLLALPIVKGTSLADQLTGGSSTPTGQAAAPGGTAPVDLGTDGGFGSDGLGDLGPASSTGSTTIDTAARTTDTKPARLEIVPPEILDTIFDALPPITFPALPPELEPLTNAIAPLAATGCSGLGLAGVVVAVAAQTANGVPIERLLPYLAPASTAYAAFPIPAKHTVCDADKPFIQDISGLATTPPILGLGIDELRALEVLLSSTFGQSIPHVADQLSAQLHCSLVS